MTKTFVFSSQMIKVFHFQQNDCHRFCCHSLMTTFVTLVILKWQVELSSLFSAVKREKSNSIGPSAPLTTSNNASQKNFLWRICLKQNFDRNDQKTSCGKPNQSSCGKPNQQVQMSCLHVTSSLPDTRKFCAVDICLVSPKQKKFVKSFVCFATNRCKNSQGRWCKKKELWRWSSSQFFFSIPLRARRSRTPINKY